jgi:hypothetical protein
VTWMRGGSEAAAPAPLEPFRALALRPATRTPTPAIKREPGARTGCEGSNGTFVSSREGGPAEAGPPALKTGVAVAGGEEKNDDMRDIQM